MRIFIVYAHPEPQSFNNQMFMDAIEALTSDGHEVKFSDLYAMEFTPQSGRPNFLTVKDGEYYQQQDEEQFASAHNGFAPEIEAEIQKIEWCDLMIWQFPLWWFGLPGILKGWVDRVFANGRIFGNQDRKVDMQKKHALLSLTTGSPEEAYAAGSFNGEIAAILWPIQRGILEFVGMKALKANIVHGLNRKSREELEADISGWRNRLHDVSKEINK